MAEKYKSVLEKYNEDKKPRLPTAEEEAIEPVYPEEYLIGGPGKAVASGLKSGAEKAAAKAAQRERIANVKIGSRVPDPEAVAADKAVSDKFYKTPQGQVTYEELKKQAQRRKEVKDLRAQERFLLGQSERASKNFFGEGGYDTGSRMAEERRNAAGDTYKKGGKVTASSRADGIASRGKTRGRMVK